MDTFERTREALRELHDAAMEARERSWVDVESVKRFTAALAEGTLALRAADADRGAVLPGAPWEVEVCDECGRTVNDSEHATSSHQNGPTHWVEVVPVNHQAGAV
jgi:uncharacterized protein YecE (DUF72 family)